MSSVCLLQWVAGETPGTAVKIENANQFAPVGVDPKELRSKFHEVCQPQSRRVCWLSASCL